MPNVLNTGLRLAAAATMIAYLALTAVTPASAQSTNGFQHFIDCAGLMFTDPARHAAECGPGHEFTGQFSNAWGTEDAQPAPACPELPAPSALKGPVMGTLPMLVQVADCCPIEEQAFRGPADATSPMILPVACGGDDEEEGEPGLI